MSEIKLTDDLTIDPAQIESAKLLKKGAKIASGITGQTFDDAELTAPEDELIVSMRDGTGFALRGEREAKRAWDALERARRTGNLNFPMVLSDRP